MKKLLFLMMCCPFVLFAETVDMSNSELKEFPSIEERQDVTKINLNSNDIKDISLLKDFPNLESLDLSENEIVDIEILSSLPNLKWVDLRHNYINKRDEKNLETIRALEEKRVSVYFKPQKKDVFSLSSRGLKSIPEIENKEEITELSISYNQISEIPEGVFDGFIHLETIYLDNNQIMKIHKNAFRNLPKLRYIYLFDNQIANFEGLGNLDKLFELDLSGNNITNLDGLMLSELYNLEVDRNMLEEVTFEHLASLKKLERLLLNENEIEKIRGLELLPSLKRLDIRRNNIDLKENGNMDCIQALREKGVKIDIGAQSIEDL